MNRKTRSKTTGQFSRPVFELWLNDFGNLALQLVDTDENKARLESMAEAMNQLFLLGGNGERFQAAVHESSETAMAEPRGGRS